MTATIYHNPRCAKSRATLQLLEARGLKPNIVDYLKTPPSAGELKAILRKLGLKAARAHAQGRAPLCRTWAEGPRVE